MLGNKRCKPNSQVSLYPLSHPSVSTNGLRTGQPEGASCVGLPRRPWRSIKLYCMPRDGKQDSPAAYVGYSNTNDLRRVVLWWPILSAMVQIQANPNTNARDAFKILNDDLESYKNISDAAATFPLTGSKAQQKTAAHEPSCCHTVKDDRGLCSHGYTRHQGEQETTEGRICKLQTGISWSLQCASPYGIDVSRSHTEPSRNWARYWGEQQVLDARETFQKIANSWRQRLSNLASLQMHISKVPRFRPVWDLLGWDPSQRPQIPDLQNQRPYCARTNKSLSNTKEGSWTGPWLYQSVTSLRDQICLLLTISYQSRRRRHKISGEGRKKASTMSRPTCSMTIGMPSSPSFTMCSTMSLTLRLALMQEVTNSRSTSPRIWRPTTSPCLYFKPIEVSSILPQSHWSTSGRREMTWSPCQSIRWTTTGLSSSLD